MLQENPTRMEVNISAEVSGQLIQLPVKEGDQVEAETF